MIDASLNEDAPSGGPRLVANLRYLLEPQGFDVDDWSMSFERGLYRLRNDLAIQAATMAFEPVLSFEPGYQPISGFVNFSFPTPSGEFCGELRQQSLAAFTKIRPEDIFAKDQVV